MPRVCSHLQIAVAVILNSVTFCEVFLSQNFIARLSDQESRYQCRVRSKSLFLHAEPLHDDIMLGCLLSVLRAAQLTHEQKHHFVCATSGFITVSNPHMLELFEGTWQKFDPSWSWDVEYSCPNHDGCVDHRRRDAWKYLEGIAA